MSLYFYLKRTFGFQGRDGFISSLKSKDRFCVMILNKSIDRGFFTINKTTR